MLDLKLIEDGISGEFDLSIDPSGDLATVDDLSTALLVSLLTDARADESQVVVPEFRRGWIGNAVPPIEGFELGCLLWLVDTAKATQGTMNIAAAFARDGLQWLLDQGIAADVQVEGAITGPGEGGLTITITSPDGTTQTQYIDLWRRTVFQTSRLPAPIADPAPFSPLSIADLSIWGDADLSEHDVDADCGVSLTKDITGQADYFQANAANRPLRLLGSGGWFYRFDGVDDHMATLNQQLPSQREGSAFYIYKPLAGATAGDRFFTLGFNGFTDAVNGITFSQEAGDVVRLRADNGNLQVDVQGTGSGALPFGVVLRWGPADSGGDAETSTGQAASDPGYTNQLGGPDIAVLGAGFDGANVDTLTAAAFELSAFALYSRRISDAEVLQLLDYAETRLFTSPQGEPASDCTYPTDDFGMTDG